MCQVDNKKLNAEFLIGKNNRKFRAFRLRLNGWRCWNASLDTVGIAHKSAPSQPENTWTGIWRFSQQPILRTHLSILGYGKSRWYYNWDKTRNMALIFPPVSRSTTFVPKVYILGKWHVHAISSTLIIRFVAASMYLITKITANMSLFWNIYNFC